MKLNYKISDADRTIEAHKDIHCITALAVNRNLQDTSAYQIRK